MAKDYVKPTIVPIRFEFDEVQLARTEAYMTLSRKDVLAIIQSAFEELGPQSPELIAIKRHVLNEVADGRLALALRTAIVGAGRSRPSAGS